MVSATCHGSSSSPKWTFPGNIAIRLVDISSEARAQGIESQIRDQELEQEMQLYIMMQ
jgi:hypothetical protein